MSSFQRLNSIPYAAALSLSPSLFRPPLPLLLAQQTHHESHGRAAAGPGVRGVACGGGVNAVLQQKGVKVEIDEKRGEKKSPSVVSIKALSSFLLCVEVLKKAC